MQSETAQLWDDRDTAFYLKKSLSWLRNGRVYHRDQTPPFIRIGRNIRYDPAAVKAWVVAQSARSVGGSRR